MGRRRSGPISPEHKFCDIYVDCDALYFQQFATGSTTHERVVSTAASVLNLFSLVAAIFDSNFDSFNVALAGITVHTTLEVTPPSNHDMDVTFYAYAKLLVDQVTGMPADIRNGGPRADQVCLNHLLTYHDYNNNAAGRAYIGAICQAQPFSSSVGYQLLNVGITAANFDATTNSRIFAHELGHNFGSYHDSVSDPTCYPSGNPFLMAPSDANGSNGGTFSSCSRAVMLQEVATKGACFRTAEDTASTASTRDPSITTSTATTVPPSAGGGWMLAGFGQSCAATCPNSVCAVSSANRLTNSSILESVLGILPGSFSCASYAGATSPRLSFSSSSTVADVCFYATGATTCSATSPTSTRQLCCCSSVGCPIPALNFTTTTTTRATTTTTTTTTNAAAQGWAIGALGKSCSQTCGAVGCNTVSQNAIQTSSAFEYVRSLIGGTPSCTFYSESAGYAEDPSWYPEGVCFLSGGISTCASSDPNTQRMCCKSVHTPKHLPDTVGIARRFIFFRNDKAVVRRAVPLLRRRRPQRRRRRPLLPQLRRQRQRRSR
eukprot:m.360689 g.360689  ORF g.360689 m.360689 type:complete len:548 (+) comp56004_c0_seq58:807-2450(+)